MLKIDNRELEIMPEPLQIYELITEVTAEFFTQIQERQQSLVLDDSLQALPPIEVDEIVFKTVTRHLVQNAIKYSPAEEPVRIEVRDAGEFVEIAISDKGRGLDGASQTSLTKRFGRGGNVEDIVGSGLGLTIVEEVAQAHGGRFDLKQQPEGGTCAIFSLPRH